MNKNRPCRCTRWIFLFCVCIQYAYKHKHRDPLQKTIYRKRDTSYCKKPNCHLLKLSFYFYYTTACQAPPFFVSTSNFPYDAFPGPRLNFLPRTYIYPLKRFSFNLRVLSLKVLSIFLDTFKKVPVQIFGLDCFGFKCYHIWVNSIFRPCLRFKCYPRPGATLRVLPLKVTFTL